MPHACSFPGRADQERRQRGEPLCRRGLFFLPHDRDRASTGATTMTDDRYDWRAIQERWLPEWEKLDPFRAGHAVPRRAPVRAGHVPLPVRRPAHGPRRGVRAGRRDRPLLVPAAATTCCTRSAGTPSACPPRTPRSSATRNPAEWTYANIETQAESFRRYAVSLRLVAPAAHLRPRVLPLDPVAVPEAVRARPGLPQGVAGQLVPERPDRAGQRAGRRRRAASGAAPRSPSAS